MADGDWFDLRAPRRDRTRELVRCAQRQAGRIARWQLVALEWTDDHVDRRVRAGLLVPRGTGVFAVGPPLESSLASAWEAVLEGGGDAALTSSWGCWQHELLAEPVGPVDVATTSQRGRRASGLRLHRRDVLRERDVAIVDGLRVMAPAECLLALARRRPKLLPRALNEAQRRLVDVGDLRALALGRRGGRALLAALDAHDPREEHTREELERRALRMLTDRGAPTYEPNAGVEAGGIDWEVDGLYREERLVVELQSEAHHSTPAERRQDRRKANALQGAGYGLLQWDWQDVTQTPDATVARLLGVLTARA